MARIDAGNISAHGAGSLLVQKRASGQDARSAAGASKLSSFARGRFVFESEDAAYLARMRAAFGG